MSTQVSDTALDALWHAATAVGVIVDTEARFADVTTSHAGAPTLGIIRCRNAQQVSAVVRAALEYDVPLLTLGGGSNLIAGDASVGVEQHQLVLLQQECPTTAEEKISDVGRIVEPGIQVAQEDQNSVTVQVSAGVNWDTFVRFTVYQDWGGVECLSGIPGQVGATPVQNVGAYGVEVESVLERVQLVDRLTGAITWESADGLDLNYRCSNLKFTNRAVVTAVEFRLRKGGLSAPIRYRELARQLGCTIGDRVQVEKAREVVLKLRRGKGMVVCGTGTQAGGLGAPQQSGIWMEICDGMFMPDADTYSTGSFFTNPIVSECLLEHVTEQVAAAGIDPETMPKFPGGGGVKLSAAWLIDHAGFKKGFPGDGNPARLSTRHTLALTNRGTATTADLLKLAEQIRYGVWKQFGVELVPEPVLVGCQLKPL